MLLEMFEYTNKATDQLYSVKLKERFIKLFEDDWIDTTDPLAPYAYPQTKIDQKQIEKVRNMSWEEIAEALYQLLDDIDTASDVCKEDMKGFQTVVLRIQQDKNLYMYSPDGYTIKRVGESKLAEKSISLMSTDELLRVQRYWESLLPGQHVETERDWLEKQLEDVKELLKSKPVEDPPYTLEPKLKEGTVDHAQRKLQLAGMFDKDVDGSDAMGSWNILCAEAVIELMKVFAEQGHSGMSVSMTRALFNKLSNFETLTELTDNPEEWNDVADKFGCSDNPMWQSRRCPSAFSEDGGKTYYNLNDDCFKYEEDGVMWNGDPEKRGVKRTMHTSKAA